MNNNAKTIEQLNENKIEKSLRNFEEFHLALGRATNGDYDELVTKEDTAFKKWLKVEENFVIHKLFSLETGKEYYKLYKEVFYVEDPAKYYFETVNNKVYKRIAGQHETGDKDWAKTISAKYGIKIVEE